MVFVALHTRRAETIIKSIDSSNREKEQTDRVFQIRMGILGLHTLFAHLLEQKAIKLLEEPVLGILLGDTVRAANSSLAALPLGHATSGA